MPIYEYRCRNCSHELEIMQKMSDQPLTHCPECGQNSLDKLISRSSFRLKGGGWYESGYANQKSSVSDNGSTSTVGTESSSSSVSSSGDASVSSAGEAKTKSTTASNTSASTPSAPSKSSSGESS